MIMGRLRGARFNKQSCSQKLVITVPASQILALAQTIDRHKNAQSYAQQVKKGKMEPPRKK
jgi:hypothetical protein